jgi:mono/diheme cytochrome c family protein
MTRFAAAPPLLLVAFLQAKSCSSGRTVEPAVTPTPSPAATAVPPSPVPAPTQTPDVFATVIRPVVQAHCAPCHEPGGKMYARLPFDDPKVLSSHSEGVLRRLKGEDKEKFERWIASLKTN